MFDTFRTYNLYANSVGYKILETKDNHFLLLSLTGFSAQSGFSPSHPAVTLTKIDNCGNYLWTVVQDTLTCTDICTNCMCASVVNMLQEPDESVIYAVYYKDYNLSVRGIKLINTDKNGNLKWKYKIGDTTKYYNLNTLIKINTNRYLLSGSYANSDQIGNKQMACIIMADTLGNTIFQKTFNQDTASDLTYAYKKSANDIILLGNEDSAILIINIDTLGNTTNFKKTTKIAGGFKTNGNLVLNHDSSELRLSNFSLSPSYLIYLAKLRLDGTLIKDTSLHFIAGSWIGRLFKYFSANSTAFSVNKTMYIIDSNYMVIWKDSTSHPDNSGGGDLYTVPFNDAILSQNSTITYIGYCSRRIGTSRAYYALIVKKSIIKYVKSITINGSNYIFSKGGKIQLSATISPINANNQQVTWSLSDTNLATIIQTGLVTAKANGVVLVTAKADDGSGITANKTIIIANQSVGIDDAIIENLKFEIYPNPATIEINIVLLQNVVLNTISIYDLLGNEFKNIPFSNTSTQIFTLNLSLMETGCYFIGIDTNKGRYFHKLIVNK